MSFYLDDDDNDIAVMADAKEADRSEPGFACDNCGGIESYLDETSGGLICVECFTQSQTMIAASQEQLEFEDTMALAGRVSGRLKSTSSYLKKGPRARKRLEEIDQSAPLPKVEQCILGFQRILKETSTIVAQLIDCPPEVTNIATDACRTIWNAYMTSWMQGADYYGAIYPEVRFCFRDAFLNNTFRRNLLRTLAYQASKKIRQEIKDKTAQDDETDTETVDVDVDAHMRVDEEATFASIGNPESAFPISLVETNEEAFTVDDDDTVPASHRPHKQHVNPIAAMIMNHQKSIRKHKLGRKATALYLSPSIEMVAAIACMAFHPYGVTCANIRAWIETGSLPLLNAFQMLIPQERKKLKLIKPFFRLAEPPSTRQLETLVTSLQVACGYEPPKLVVYTKQKKLILDSKELFTKHPGRLLTPRSLPLATARIVGQLGLSQTVLNFSLALMGLPFIPDKTKIGPKHRIPTALRACRTDKIVRMSELLGVVVTACKYIPRWEDHWYEKVAYDEITHKTQGANVVPWNQAEIHQLYGSCSEAHLELLERKIMRIDDSLLFSDDAHSYLHTNLFDDMHEADTKDAVFPSSTVLRLHPSSREKSHLSRIKGVLFEASEDGIQGIVPAPPLGTLIEYVATKTGASPRKILKFHLKLGEEMQRRAKKQEEREKRKKESIPSIIVAP